MHCMLFLWKSSRLVSFSFSPRWTSRDILVLWRHHLIVYLWYYSHLWLTPSSWKWYSTICVCLKCVPCFSVLHWVWDDKGHWNGEVYSTCLYECIQMFSKNFVFCCLLWMYLIIMLVFPYFKEITDMSVITSFSALMQFSFII